MPQFGQLIKNSNGKYKKLILDLTNYVNPISNKKEIFKRALSFGKPFALIMNVAWLLDSAPAKLFENKDLQLLLFKNRMEFDRPEKTEFTGKVNFSAGYFCWNFLPKQIIFRTLQIPRRKRHG